MRILLVGNIFGRELCANYYFTMEKLLHGFARSRHAVQIFNDREAARIANPFHTQKLGKRTANTRLIKAAGNYRPDIVVLGHCEMISNATIAEIRATVPGTRIIYRNVDPLHFSHNRARIERRGGAVDAIFVTTAGEAAASLDTGTTPVYFMPNPVDPAVETLQNFQYNDQDHDLFFAISHSKRKHNPRADMAARLQAELTEVACDFRGMHGKPSRRGAAYFDFLCNARMGLSYNRVNDHYLYSSGRMAQYMGNGLLTFMDRATGFGDILAEDEAGFYSSFEELCDKIRYYKNNDEERRKVAEKGWARMHQLFDSQKVADYLLDITFDRTLSHDYGWPTHAWS